MAEFGWQDDDDYLVAAGTRADIDPGPGLDDEAFDRLTMDPPALLVSKRDGSLRTRTGTMGTNPTDDMSPIGDAPQRAGDGA